MRGTDGEGAIADVSGEFVLIGMFTRGQIIVRELLGPFATDRLATPRD